jgi:hypothetical protein
MAAIAVCVGLLCSGARTSADSGPSVKEYAKKCFDRLELKNHDDLKGPFQCKAPGARRLVMTIDGNVKDIGLCDPKKGSCPKEGDPLPAKCDFPAWLEMGGKSCYGNSYIQKISPKSNPDITAALLCRHKYTWSDDPKTFQDIAMIVHNEKNGETCWFQTSDAGSSIDGTKVPGPETDAAVAFYMTPLDTARVMCVQCHDNGPFMNSRWMANALLKPGDDISSYPPDSYPLWDNESGKYKNSEPPFDAWPKPRFVDAGNNPDGDSCTLCHKIAAGGDRKKVTFLDGTSRWMDFQTCADCNAICAADPSGARCGSCRGWILRVTGRTKDLGSGVSTHPAGADAAALKDDIAIWMPPPAPKTPWTRKAWDAKYKKHVDHLMKCCAAVGNAKPGDKINTGDGLDCKEYVPK